MEKYRIKSQGQLTTDRMRDLARQLHCPISEIGKGVNDEIWEYWLDMDKKITDEQKKIISASNLELLLPFG